MTEKKLTKKEKALICATVVGAGIAGYFGIKYFKQKSYICKLEHRVTVLETVVSEDVLEEANRTDLESIESFIF